MAPRPTQISRKGLLVEMDEIQRGEIWWADLPEPRRSEPRRSEPRRSEPGYRRPVLVVQVDSFNLSRIQTAIVAVISGNLELADAQVMSWCRRARQASPATRS